MIVDLGILSIDFSFWVNLFNQPTSTIIWSLFFIFGWAIIAGLLFFLASYFWEEYHGNKYTANWEPILLAIDVPAIAVQTPKAIEQIFAHLSGALEPPNVWERWWQGKVQRWFSFEIISIEGYIQFLVWTEKGVRDLVEASIYAQYPEAEITEVEDYVDLVPDKYPDKEYNMHGVEFALAQNDAFPLRTYPDFKYDVTPDITFSDSMAAMLENFTRIGKGEHLWMQIVIVPTSTSWKEKGIKLVKEIIAGKKETSPGILSQVGSLPAIIAKDAISYGWRDGSEGESSHESEKEVAGKVSDLTPGGRKVIEAVENKISKIGFKSKMRLLYVSKNEIFNPRKCMGGVVGAMNQFHVGNSNALISYASTMSKGTDKNISKNTFFKAYKKRKVKSGSNPYILNIEELATLWHFPMPFVKTPLVQRTEAKRSEAPSDLPTEVDSKPLRVKNPVVVRESPPDNLPAVEENFSTNEVVEEHGVDTSQIKTDISSELFTDASPKKE